jgi:galactokinase
MNKTEGSTLQTIYGLDPILLRAEQARYMHVDRRFTEEFGPSPARVLRTPGRINLIGEHTDYNGGFVLPVALDRDILCVARPRQDCTVRAVNVEPEFAPFSFELAHDIPTAPHGDWSNYFRGACQEIVRQFGDRLDLKGMDICVSGQPPYGVPRGAGLSSSTALTVTAALAMVLLNDIEVKRASLAHLCSQAEWYVGTRGGMMDQFSALLGQPDRALFLDCRPAPDGTYSLAHIPIPSSTQIILLNSGVRHENVRSQFNQRVAECKIGVQLLRQRDPNIEQLRDVTSDALDLGESDLWTLLNETLPVCATIWDLMRLGLDRRWLDELIADHRLDPGGAFAVLPRCRHILTENERVLAGITALRAGQVETFGVLMDEAHASMRDDYGASCPQVDKLVDIVRQQPGVLGARITGAGWGGGVVALARRGHAAEWTEAVQVAYREATGLQTNILICRPGGGAAWDIRYTA